MWSLKRAARNHKIGSFTIHGSGVSQYRSLAGGTKKRVSSLGWITAHITHGGHSVSPAVALRVEEIALQQVDEAGWPH